MKFIPKLWAESADQKHVNNRSRLVSAPGANYYNGCQTSNVWRRNMSRSRESRPRGSRKQQTKITFAARARTLNRSKKNCHGAQGFALLDHSLLIHENELNLNSWTCSQAYGPMACKINREANKQRESRCERQARKQRGRLWFRNSMGVPLHRRRVLNSMVNRRPVSSVG